MSVSVPYSTKSPVVAQEKSTGAVLRHHQNLPYQDVGKGILHIPLHEVLQQSMQSSTVTILDQTVSLLELIPEYRLQDLPSEILERLEEGQSLHQLQEDSVDGGFFLRKFPSFQQAERDSKKMRPNIRKMVCVWATHVCVGVCVGVHSMCCRCVCMCVACVVCVCLRVYASVHGMPSRCFLLSLSVFSFTLLSVLTSSPNI